MSLTPEELETLQQEHIEAVVEMERLEWEIFESQNSEDDDE